MATKLDPGSWLRNRNCYLILRLWRTRTFIRCSVPKHTPDVTHGNPLNIVVVAEVKTFMRFNNILNHLLLLHVDGFQTMDLLIYILEVHFQMTNVLRNTVVHNIGKLLKVYQARLITKHVELTTHLVFDMLGSSTPPSQQSVGGIHWPMKQSLDWNSTIQVY